MENPPLLLPLQGKEGFHKRVEAILQHGLVGILIARPRLGAGGNYQTEAVTDKLVIAGGINASKVVEYAVNDHTDHLGHLLGLCIASLQTVFHYGGGYLATDAECAAAGDGGAYPPT